MHDKLKEFYLWVDQNLIDQSPNLLKSVELAKCVITNAIEQSSIKKDSKDITPIKINPSNSGIYIILNIVNNKYYVGSSFHLDTRYNYHKNLLNKNKHHCPKLQKDWNEFGEENFEYHIVDLIPEENLGEEEQKYLNHCKLDKSKNYLNGENAGRSPVNTKTKDMQYQVVLQALRETNGNKTKTALITGISRRTIHRIINKYNII